MALVLACDSADYNPTTGECAAPYFTELHLAASSALPPLTVEEGFAIAGAILLVWGVAFAFRVVIRTLNTLN